MPKYVYQGLNSGVTFELEQRISDPALTHHPETLEPVKRLIGRPAIAFKGSGFYANDSRSGGGDSKAANPSGESSSESGSAAQPAASSQSPSTPSGDAGTGAASTGTASTPAASTSTPAPSSKS